MRTFLLVALAAFSSTSEAANPPRALPTLSGRTAHRLGLLSVMIFGDAVRIAAQVRSLTADKYRLALAAKSIKQRAQ